MTHLGDTYPVSKSVVNSETWQRLADCIKPAEEPESFPQIVAEYAEDLKLPGYLPDLARLEFAFNKLRSKVHAVPEKGEGLAVNPTLQLLESKWKNLDDVFDSRRGDSKRVPEPGNAIYLLWLHPEKGSESY